MHRDAGRNHRCYVLGAGPQDFAAADLELVIWAVNYGGAVSQSSQVNQAAVNDSGLNEPFGGNRVAGMEHHTVSQGPEHGDVFQAHLGSAIGTNGDSGMRAAEFDIPIGILAHADLIE